MKPSRRITWTATALLLLCLLASVVVLRRVDQIRGDASLEEVLYVSSPKVLKRLSLGYSGLLADVYWTRAVQYYGSKHLAGAEDYKLLAPLLEITTALDPHLIVAYEFGASFLSPQPPNGAGLPQKAIELVEYGIRNKPDDWRLYYQLGFIHYTELKDYPAAEDAFVRGSRVPNAHPWMKILAAQMAQHAGDWETARMMWDTTYETTKDKSIRANAVAHLRALQVDRDVSALEVFVAQYRETTGHAARSFSDLIAARMLRGVPVDPLGQPYKLAADGRVEVQSPDDLPFIQKGTPPGYVPPRKPKVLPTD